MKLARDLIVDSGAAPTDGSGTLATWYAPGLVDELGDRLLMFDNSSAPSLELLRFRRALTATPGFEVALRRRVERLRQFQHPSFARVRAVEYLGPDEGLALLSNHTPGRRLSEVLQDARSPAFAISLIRQLTPALMTLQQCDGIGHGAVAPSRIVIGSDGRLVIVEHVLGSALERLQLPANRLRADFGIAVPPSDSFVRPRFDSRTDCFQLGLVAISLLLGRPLGPDEYARDLVKLLDLAARSADRESPRLFPRLRVWLERALQLDGASFETAGEALDALNDLSSANALPGLDPVVEEPPTLATPPVAPAETQVATEPLPESAAPEPEPPPPVRQRESPHPIEREVPVSISRATSGNHEVTVMDAHAPASPNSSLFNEIHVAGAGSPAAFLDESLLSAPRPGSRGRSVRPEAPKPPPSAVPASRRQTIVRSLIVALAFCAVGEGLVILMLMQRRGTPQPTAITVDTVAPGADVLVDGRVAGVTPLELKLAGNTRSIRVVAPRAESTNVVAPAPERHEVAASRTGGTAAAAAPAQHAGGIRVSSPIEVEVFEGDRRLGSSATGIVPASTGRHTLDLVNSALGYRSRQVVTVSAGRVAPLNIALPNGRLSVNALPWAEVLIDGKSVGETPLGNLAVPLGEHEIVFRHPQLGERRQTAVVRVDGVTRVSANLQR